MTVPLPPYTPFQQALLQSHLQQQAQQQLFSQQDLSRALLAGVTLLPYWAEDSPKAPCVLGECVGTLLGAGQLDFGLRELAAAVAAAGLGPDDEFCDVEQPPLIEQGVAAPVLLAAAGAIKVGVGVHGDRGATASWMTARRRTPTAVPVQADTKTRALCLPPAGCCW